MGTMEEALNRIIEVTGIKEMATIKKAIEYCKKTTGKSSAHIDHIVNVLIEGTYDEEFSTLTKESTSNDSSTVLQTGIVGGRISKEEVEISKVLEQSLSKSNQSETKVDQSGDKFWYLHSQNPHERKREVDTPTGIANVGSTCWFSAVIQSLFWIPNFRNIILEFDQNKQPSMDSVSFILLVELKKLFALLMNTKRKYVDPSKVVNIFKNILGNQNLDCLDLNRQQDVSEFLHKLLDMIEEALKSQISSDDKNTYNKIQENFYGKIIKQATDLNITNKNEVEVIGQLPLSIDGLSNLHEAIEKTLCGDSTNQRESWFQELPQILIFELLRFKYNKNEMTAEKINDPIEFWKNIYMDRYMECNFEDIKTRRKKCNIIKKELHVLKRKLNKYINYNATVPNVSIVQILNLTQKFIKDANLNINISELNTINSNIIKETDALISLSSDTTYESFKQNPVDSVIGEFTKTDEYSLNHNCRNDTTKETKENLETESLHDLDLRTTEFNLTESVQKLSINIETPMQQNDLDLKNICKLEKADKNKPHHIENNKKNDLSCDNQISHNKIDLIKSKCALEDLSSTETNVAELNEDTYEALVVRPNQITIQEFNMLQNCLSRWQSQVNVEIQNLEKEIQTKEKIIESLYNDPNLMKYPYRLHAILVHEGEVSLGHYWAYVCTNPASNIWHKFNDVSVTNASTADMFKDGTGSHQGSSNAYCFVYVNARNSQLFDDSNNDLPLDMMEYVDNDNAIFTKELIDWDARQNNYVTSSVQSNDHSRDHENKEDMNENSNYNIEINENSKFGFMACKVIQYETLNLRHAYLSIESMQSIVDRISNHSAFNEDTLENILKQIFNEIVDLKNENKLRTQCNNKLQPCDERISDVFTFFLLNNVETRMLWICFLEKLTFSILKGRREKSIVNISISLLKKNEDSYDRKLYQKWHLIYHIFRETISSLVNSIENFEWRSYEASLIPIMNAVYMNNLLMRYGQYSKVNQEILLFYRRECLLKFSEKLIDDLKRGNLINIKEFNEIFLPCLFSLIYSIPIDITQQLLPLQDKLTSGELKRSDNIIEESKLNKPIDNKGLEESKKDKETDIKVMCDEDFLTYFQISPELEKDLPIDPKDVKLVEIIRQKWCDLLSEALPPKSTDLLSDMLNDLMDMEMGTYSIHLQNLFCVPRLNIGADIFDRYCKVADFINISNS